MHSGASLVLLICLGCLTPSPSLAADNAEQLSLDLVDLLAKLPEFSTLSSAIKKAKIAERFKGDLGPYTVFAPTDAAFRAVDKKAFAEVLADENKLAAVIEQHVLGGKIKGNEFPAGSTDLKTIGNQDLTVVNELEEGNQLKVKGKSGKEATVISTDIEAKNGIIHSIDHVL